MIYGWYKDSDGKYSFFNTKHDRTFGKRLVGWHWIDGYRYYFGNDEVLYQNTTTPDGSQVDKDGRYMKNSIIQHVGGKGLSLKPHMSEQTKKNFLQNQTQQAKGDNKAKKERESNHDSKQDKTYTVTFDFNDGTPSKKETQSVKEGNYVEYLEPPYRDGYYFLAWYQEKEVQDFDNGFSFDGTPIHKDITLYALWLDTTHDSDSDGLLDGHEMILKTDPHKTDTDGDGLTDSEEHNFTTTDPLKTHTYLDDTADAELDIDGDGLTNLEEVRFGSNPIFEDYDEDSLNDKQEKEHGTNPNNKDTDSDGLIDGLEIKYGFNPTNPDTNGDGILDGDELITVTKKYDGTEGNSRPSAVITLKVGNAEHISIDRDNPKESIWIPEEGPGLLDASYDFEVDGEIEEATLTFHFDETYAPSEEFEPAIYYVDTENQEMILLEDQDIDWINHTVTAKTKHFSKYVLLNKKQQEKAWKEEILSSGNIGNNARIEVSFVIDESGSMSSNDSGKVRVEVAKKFIDTLRNSDKAAVIGFAYDGITYQALTENLQAAKQSLDNISNNRGGTNLSAGLEQAMAQYPVAGNNSNQKEQAMKIIVFLTDGEGSYNKQYEQMAIERGIKIYTVGLGNYYDKALLTKISNNTGGKHYHANNAEQLIQEFQKLTRDTIDVVNDTDHDGLSDYHEERIRLFNGVVVKLDKMKADTDSDGLKDGQEIIQRTDKKGRVFFKLHSYPNKRDSDGDGIEDKQDEKPLIPQRYTIDYLGSPKHLKSMEERLDKQIKNNLLSLDKADKPM